MQAEELKDYISEIEKRNSHKDWVATLNSRKKAELEFHNRDRDENLTQSLPQDTFELLHGNKKYYSTVQLSTAYVDNWIAQNANGKVFLDYACGNGKQAFKAAKSGARLALGLDISDVSVQNARRRAAQENLADRCLFVQGDCENTGLPDHSVDVILCSGMLHHLDLSFAFPELRRILKPGGKVLAVEALNYNPFIKAYRWLTPSMRTDWEKNHILSLKDVRFARRFFDVGEIHYWHMFSIFAAGLRNSEKLQTAALGVLNGLDRICTRIPILNLMAWQFTFEMTKRLDN